MENNLLFVYGKLRKGGALPMDENFPDAIYIGEATVDGKLYDLGQFPGLILDGTGSEVFGAVYKIDEATIVQLDEIEASAEYYRQLRNATVDDEKIECWIYLPDPQKCTDDKFIESGDWIEHSRS